MLLDMPATLMYRSLLNGLYISQNLCSGNYQCTNTVPLLVPFSMKWKALSKEENRSSEDTSCAAKHKYNHVQFTCLIRS